MENFIRSALIKTSLPGYSGVKNSINQLPYFTCQYVEVYAFHIRFKTINEKQPEEWYNILQDNAKIQPGNIWSNEYNIDYVGFNNKPITFFEWLRIVFFALKKPQPQSFFIYPLLPIIDEIDYFLQLMIPELNNLISNFHYRSIYIRALITKTNEFRRLIELGMVSEDQKLSKYKIIVGQLLSGKDLLLPFIEYQKKVIYDIVEREMVSFIEIQKYNTNKDHHSSDNYSTSRLNFRDFLEELQNLVIQNYSDQINTSEWSSRFEKIHNYPQYFYDLEKFLEENLLVDFQNLYSPTLLNQQTTLLHNIINEELESASPNFRNTFQKMRINTAQQSTPKQSRQSTTTTTTHNEEIEDLPTQPNQEPLFQPNQEPYLQSTIGVIDSINLFALVKRIDARIKEQTFINLEEWNRRVYNVNVSLTNTPINKPYQEIKKWFFDKLIFSDKYKLILTDQLRQNLTQLITFLIIKKQDLLFYPHKERTDSMVLEDVDKTSSRGINIDLLLTNIESKCCTVLGINKVEMELRIKHIYRFPIPSLMKDLKSLIQTKIIENNAGIILTPNEIENFSQKLNILMSQTEEKQRQNVAIRNENNAIQENNKKTELKIKKWKNENIYYENNIKNLEKAIQQEWRIRVDSYKFDKRFLKN